MTATNVYGVMIGDQFIDANGNTLTVEEFITPTTHTMPWKATVSTYETGTRSQVEVKALQGVGYRRAQP